MPKLGNYFPFFPKEGVMTFRDFFVAIEQLAWIHYKVLQRVFHVSAWMEIKRGHQHGKGNAVF